MPACTTGQQQYYVNPAFQARTPFGACSLQTQAIGGSSYQWVGTTCTVNGVYGTNVSRTFTVYNHCTPYNPATDGILWNDQTVMMQVLLVAVCVVMLVIGYRSGDKT